MKRLLLALSFLFLAAMEGAAQPVAPNQVNGCIYLTTLPTLTNGQTTPFHCDVNGKLLTTGGGGGTGTITANSTPTSGFGFDNLVYSDGSLVQSLNLGVNVFTALGSTLNGIGALAGTTSPVFVTPTLGAAAGTSLALGGATLGSNALAVTGTSALGTSVSINGNVTLFAPTAGVLQDRTGTTAQIQQWYQSYTDVNNGAWGAIDAGGDQRQHADDRQLRQRQWDQHAVEAAV